MSGAGRGPGRRKISREIADPVEASDRAIVRRIRVGDETALAELFHAYAPALAEFVNRYVRDVHAAEELVQDVFLWIIRNRTTWSVQGTVRSYLYGAARNHALDYVKHRAVEQRWAHRITHQRDHTVAPDAEHYLVANERAEQLARAIAQLPESRRTALTLRWVDELSYAEIAAILGVSLKAVENQLNRTLRQLETLLGKDAM